MQGSISKIIESSEKWQDFTYKNMINGYAGTKTFSFLVVVGTLCQGRHHNYREAEGLGTRRPLTRWVNSGTATAPDYWWRKHIVVQVERIWDTIEMAYLRLVVRDGYDALWKL